jgi:hypothetical protein
MPNLANRCQISSVMGDEGDYGDDHLLNPIHTRRFAFNGKSSLSSPNPLKPTSVQWHLIRAIGSPNVGRLPASRKIPEHRRAPFEKAFGDWLEQMPRGQSG